MAVEYEVVIEIPRGSRNKYEYDHKRGVIVLDRQLFTATHFSRGLRIHPWHPDG